jgi:hypothetical protein
VRKVYGTTLRSERQRTISGQECREITRRAIAVIAVEHCECIWYARRCEPRSAPLIGRLGAEEGGEMLIGVDRSGLALRESRVSTSFMAIH